MSDYPDIEREVPAWNWPVWALKMQGLRILATKHFLLGTPGRS